MRKTSNILINNHPHPILLTAGLTINYMRLSQTQVNKTRSRATKINQLDCGFFFFFFCNRNGINSKKENLEMLNTQSFSRQNNNIIEDPLQMVSSQCYMNCNARTSDHKCENLLCQFCCNHCRGQIPVKPTYVDHI